MILPNQMNRKKISLLEAGTRQLELRVELLKSSLIVAKSINSLLEKEVDDLQQYQRRACFVANRIRPAAGETEDQIKEKMQSVLVKCLGFDEERHDSKIDKCQILEKPKS